MDASPVFRDDPPLPGTASTRAACCSATSTATGSTTSSTSRPTGSRAGSTRAASGGASRSSRAARRRSPTSTASAWSTCSAPGWPACCGHRTRCPGPGSHYRFLDLTGGLKPYLLEQVDNHLGAVTTMRLRAVDEFYLADEARPATRGRRRCRSRCTSSSGVEVIDEISGGTLTNRVPLPPRLLGRRRAGVPRLRLVEQLDTERSPSPANHVPAVDERQFSPPC